MSFMRSLLRLFCRAGDCFGFRFGANGGLLVRLWALLLGVAGQLVAFWGVWVFANAGPQDLFPPISRHREYGFVRFPDAGKTLRWLRLN